jgi:ABC-type antimicrobial peptide transport system permease subunit
VGNFADDDAAQAARGDLGADPDVEAVSAYQWLTFEVDGRPVPLALFDAAAVDLAPVVLEGRAPIQADEVALGRGTLADLGKTLGDTVDIRTTGDPITATVVGVIVAPATISTSMDLDSGGSATFGLAEQAYIDTPGAVNAGGFLVALDGGADHDAAIDRLREDFPGTVLGPMKPLDVSNLQRVRGVPYLLAGLLGAMALTSVGITLAASARRRRRDVAVLRALGLARSQLRLLVAGEASTFVLLVAALGLPLGIVAGRLAWRAAADGLGSEVGPVLPGLAILGATLGVLLLVNLYGQALAVVVGRRRPGGDLRSE